MTLWLPAFFVRSHDLSQSETGLTLALMSGIVGGFGTFTAGRLADHWPSVTLAGSWIVAVGKGGLVPFLVCFFWFTDLTSALLVYLIPAFFGGFYLAPTFASAAAGAGANALGRRGNLPVPAEHHRDGLGPQGVGILSDVFAAEYGVESLRYSLMVFSLVNRGVLSVIFRRHRPLQRDTQRVAELQGISPAHMCRRKELRLKSDGRDAYNVDSDSADPGRS